MAHAASPALTNRSRWPRLSDSRPKYTSETICAMLNDATMTPISNIASVTPLAITGMNISTAAIPAYWKKVVTLMWLYVSDSVRDMLGTPRQACFI